jgi:hypothetical protein
VIAAGKRARALREHDCQIVKELPPAPGAVCAQLRFRLPFFAESATNSFFPRFACQT